MVLLLMFVCCSSYYGTMSFKFSEWTLLSFEVELSGSRGMFVFLVLSVSMVITLYANYYSVDELYFGVYSLLMLGFSLSMVLLLVSNSWITMLLGWEGLGISSFFLILSSNSWESITNGMCTLLTMRLGDFCLFLLMMPVVVGTTETSPSFALVPGEPLYLMFMCMTKSAQTPFSGWLPKAMSAPTPTSALVHSSTLVTAGLIILMSHSVFISSATMLNSLVVIGMMTMVGGSLAALSEGSIKKAVAFSTLSQMGLACMAYGLGEFYAGYWNLVSHGITKSLLFMLVGFMIHGNMNQQAIGKWSGATQIQGLFRVQLLMTLMSLSGLSFFSGMLSKEALLESWSSMSSQIIITMMITGAVYMTLYYCMVVWGFMFGMASHPVSLHQSSVSLLTLTTLHSLGVVCWFSWSGLNLITVPTGFQYTESVVPVMMVSGLMLSTTLILWSVFPHYLLQSLSGFVMTLQHYVWAQSLLVSLHFIEGLMNSVVLLGYQTLNTLSLKTAWQGSGSSVNLLALMLMVMLMMY